MQIGVENTKYVIVFNPSIHRSRNWLVAHAPRTEKSLTIPVKDEIVAKNWA